MQLTVLGRFGPFPAPGGACSGYLAEHDGARIALDMGSGCFSRLLEFVPSLRLDAVLISHQHHDHCGDMHILRYALEAGRGAAPLRLYLPQPISREYAALCESPVFDLHYIDAGQTINIAAFEITPFATAHPISAYGFSVCAGGRRLIYTGDTAEFDGLDGCCANAELLLADAAFLSADTLPAAPPHMTALQAGKLAARANVQRLLCTHLKGDAHTEAEYLAEAKSAFPAAELAQERATYTV